MAFVGVLEAVGKDFAKGLKWAVQYAVPVEQKYAASGVQAGTGPQKLAEVITLAGEAVLSLLAKAGVTATPDYVSSLASAVVALLNVQPAPAAAIAK
jgi:hypothetical protein